MASASIAAAAAAVVVMSTAREISVEGSGGNDLGLELSASARIAYCRSDCIGPGVLQGRGKEPKGVVERFPEVF